MNRSKEIDAEWIEIVPNLARSGYIPVPYRAPEGYFQSFFDRLIMAIRTEASGGLNAGRESFEVAEENAAEEIGAISPLLAGLSRKMPYQVPPNYFAEFRVSEEKTAALVADFNSAMPLESGIGDSETAAGKKVAGEAPIIQMQPHRSWRRMVAAATVTAVILTGAFFYFRPAAAGTIAGELAKVSDQDMENFVATQDMPPDIAGDSAAFQSEWSTPQRAFNENEITDLMSNVSDNELEAYASNEAQDSNLN